MFSILRILMAFQPFSYSYLWCWFLVPWPCESWSVWEEQRGGSWNELEGVGGGLQVSACSISPIWSTVFVQSCRVYFSRSQYFERRNPIQLERRDISMTENFLLVTDHQLLNHAVFFKIGQPYFSWAIEFISHRLGSILVKRKVKPKLNWTTWGVLPSLRMKSLFKWPTANQLLLCGNVKSNSNFRSLWLKLNFAERVI